VKKATTFALVVAALVATGAPPGSFATAGDDAPEAHVRPDAEKRPVLLAGAERQAVAISEWALVPAGLVHEYAGPAADPAQFRKYALVILADRSLQADGHTARSWSPQEIRTVEEYVRQGGCILFTGRVLGDICRGTDTSALPLIGAARFGGAPAGAAARILTRDKHYTETLEKESYTWVDAPYVLFGLNGGTALVGGSTDDKGPFAGMYVNNYGRGRVFYVGMDTARVARWAKDGAAYLEVLKRIAHSAGPLTVMEKKEELAARFRHDLVVWEEEQRADLGEGFAAAGKVRSLDFLFPRPGARLESVRVDMVRGEKERYPILVTPMKDAEITVEVVGSAPLKSTKIWRRTSDYHKLVPVTGRVRAKGLVTCEFWLRFSSEGSPPGEYTGSIKLSSGSSDAIRVPLVVKVWDIALPEKPSLRFSPYSGAVGFLNGLVGNPERDRRMVPQFEAYFANMKDAGFHGLNVYLHRYRFYEPARINGEEFWKLLEKDPAILKQENLPDIDFSYYDPYFAVPREKGLTEYIMLMGPASLFAPIERFSKLLGTELPPESAEYARYAVWLAREFREYLEGQGAKQLLAKHMDEISPDEIAEYNRVTSLFRRAGWKTYCTWTGKIPQTPKLIREVNANTDQWQIQLLSLDIFRTKVGRQPDLIDASDEVWFYGGGGKTYRWSYAAARAYGWYAGYYNVDGMGWWAYRMWNSRGEGVVFYDDGILYTTPALEGLADALDDAQLYLMLNRSKYPDLDRRKWDARICSFGLVGHDMGILPLTSKRYSYPGGGWDYWAFDKNTPTRLIRRARRELLVLLDESLHHR